MSPDLNSLQSAWESAFRLPVKVYNVVNFKWCCEIGRLLLPFFSSLTVVINPSHASYSAVQTFFCSFFLSLSENHRSYSIPYLTFLRKIFSQIIAKLLKLYPFTKAVIKVLLSIKDQFPFWPVSPKLLKN